MAHRFARTASLSHGVFMALACGFNSGGLDGSSADGGVDGGSGPGTEATVDPSGGVSSTASTSVTDPTDDGTGPDSSGDGTSVVTTTPSETSAAESSSDAPTDAMTTDATTTDATTTDATTTDDPTDPTDPTDSTTDATTDSEVPLYGDCDTDEDCNLGASCREFFSAGVVIATVCYESCDMVACPPPDGAADPICIDSLMACGLDCDEGDCPDGMTCYSLNVGERCGWPV